MKERKIHIIGGGIIGLSSAWYLSEEGYDVTVFDKGDLQDGTSHGNAGMIVPSHFMPMAAPGVISQGIKWMFNSKSPFFVKPRLNLELIEWLWSFYKHCNKKHVENSMSILYNFNEWSKHLYRDFSQNDNFSFCFEERGLMMLYKTEHHAKEEREMAVQARSLGIDAEDLTLEQLKVHEPDIDLDVLGGVYFKGDAHLYPNLFIRQLQKQLIAKGVKFLFNKSVNNIKTNNGKASQLLLSDSTVVDIDELLIASGSWSAKLAKMMGIKIKIQDGKGYSITLKNANIKPRIPTILTEAKVAITPMGNDLRIGGTLELGGLSPKINRSRVQGIIESVPKYFPELKIDKVNTEEIWTGYRPCSADGLPYIGKSEKIGNVFIATGHGMMGMSMGPATGKLVCEIVCDKKKTINSELFRIQR